MDAVAPMLRKFGYDPDDPNPVYGVPDGEVSQTCFYKILCCVNCYVIYFPMPKGYESYCNSTNYLMII